MAIFENPVALSAIQSEPRTYRQSQSLPDAKEWRDAAEDELRAHTENGTWEIVKLPPSQKAIGSVEYSNSMAILMISMLLTLFLID